MCLCLPFVSGRLSSRIGSMGSKGEESVYVLFGGFIFCKSNCSSFFFSIPTPLSMMHVLSSFFYFESLNVQYSFLSA